MEHVDLFAIERIPAPVCFKSLVISSSNAGLCTTCVKQINTLENVAGDIKKCWKVGCKNEKKRVSIVMVIRAPESKL